MAGKKRIHAFSIAIIALIFLAGLAVPQQMQALLYVSAFGFLALLSIIFALLIPIMLRLKKSRFTIYLLANRRWIGIWTFLFAVIHVTLVFHFFFGWDIAAALGDQYRLLGGAALLILAAMAATSNDTAVRKLGRNWKRLHYFVYAALILVIVHAFNIGQIFLKNDILKAAVVAVVAAIILWKVARIIKSRSRQRLPEAQDAEAKSDIETSSNYA